jgi:hypothetical protein
MTVEQFLDDYRDALVALAFVIVVIVTLGMAAAFALLATGL